MNISDLFFETAKKFPHHVAIIEKGTSITYSSLELSVRQTARYFYEKGIKKGDRVLVFVPMSIDLYRIGLALFYMGATAVFLDEWVSKDRLRLCCEIADCKGFVGSRKIRFLSYFIKETRSIPVKLKVNKKSTKVIDGVRVDPTHSALITFTTGSTGTPKAADRSHSFLKEQFEALIEEINPNPADIDMPVLPIVLFMNLGIGCTSVIVEYKSNKPKLFNPEEVIEKIGKHNVNRMTASPFFFKALSHHLTEKKQTIHSIEKIFTGGAPVFANEAQLFKETFPDATVKIVYGSTEAEPISSVLSDELIEERKDDDVGLYVGKPYHKTQLRIINITDEEISKCNGKNFEKLFVLNGEIGEIIVTGPHVLKKYFNNQDAFRRNKVIVENEIWHRTGDSGFIKNDKLYLTGRCQQLIKRNDELLSPFIIENKISRIEGVIKGTLLEIGGLFLLVVESNRKVDKIKEELTGIPYDKLVKVREIPMDPRHNSKIDYAKLIELVS